MARIKNGILGAFSGMIANVVGYIRNGKAYMRAKPKKRTKPATKNELANREKFAYVQRWLQPLLEFVRVGFQHYNPDYEGFVAAKSYNAKNAIIGHSPYFQIDPAKALVSFGDMSQATYAVAAAAGNSFINFRWSGGNFEYDDRAMLVAYDMAGENASFNTAAERAKSGEAWLKVDDYLKGKKVDVYLAFVSEDRKRRSNSQYLGLITLL